MVRFFNNYAFDLNEAFSQESLRSRAEMTARQFTPARVAALEAQYDRDPTLPADAALALVAAGAGPEMADQLSLELAAMPKPTGEGQLNPHLTTGRMPSPGAPVGGFYSQENARNNGGGGFGTAAAQFAFDNPISNKIGGIAESVGGALPEDFRSLAKATSRTVMPALDFGQQTLQGMARESFAAARTATDSDASWGDRLGAAVTGGSAVALPGGADPVGTVRDLLDAGSLSGGVDALFDNSVGSQTDLGQIGHAATQNALAGRPLNAGLTDFGSGFFINENAQVAQDRRRAERAMGTLEHGQTITFGRATAAGFGFDPESTGFSVLSGLLDASVALAPGLEVPGTDLIRSAGAPALVQAGGGVSRLEFSDLVRSGGMRGSYTRVNLTKANAFIDSAQADGMVDFFANASGPAGFGDIYRATKGSVPGSVINRLVDATDPDEIRALMKGAVADGNILSLRTATGRGLSTTAAGLSSTKVGALGRKVPLLGKVPPNMLDLTNGDEAVEAIYDFGRNARADIRTVDGWAQRMAGATDIGSRYDAYTEILGEMADHLTRGGIGAERAAKLTQFAADELNTSRLALDDMIGMGADEWSELVIAGEGVKLPGAFLLSERALQVPLPNARDLRRATGAMKPLWETADDLKAGNIVLRGAAGALSATHIDSLASNLIDGSAKISGVWKDTRLLRGAYTVRVIAEEQIRMAAKGYDSSIRNPLSFMALVLTDPRFADKDGLARWMGDALGRIPGVNAAGAGAIDDVASVSGKAANKAFLDSLSNSRMSGLRDGFTPRRHGSMVGISKPTPGIKVDDYVRGWKDELLTLSADPIASQVSRNGIDDTVDWLVEGAGRKHLDELLEMHPALEDATRLQDYVASLSRRIDGQTGGSSEALRLVGHGDNWEDIDLHSLVDEFGPASVISHAELGDEAVGAYDNAMDLIFEQLATKPTNRLSRVPVFRQAFDRRVAEIGGLAADSDAMLKAASRWGVPGGTIMFPVKGSARGRLTVEQVEQLAKQRAMHDVKDLLYDLTQKSQFFDAMRIVMPFGEAWKEVVTTWAKLGAENPLEITRRAGQVARTTQSQDFADTYYDLAALDAEADQGFFYENEYGDTVFYYPYSQQFTEFMSSRNSVDPSVAGFGLSIPIPWSDSGRPGVPVSMEGSLKGLNIAGEILPGIGPMAQWPAAAVMPDSTAWDPVRDLLFPFGEPAGFLERSTWLPSWLNTMAKSEPMTPEEIRLYGNTNLRTMRHLMSTGEYDLSSQAGVNDLLADSKAATNNLFMVRGMVQFGAPSSPQMAYQVIGPNGELAQQAALMDRYRTLLEEDYSTALEKLIDEVGMDNLLLAQGNTVSTLHGGTPLEGAGYDWVRDNPSVAETDPQLFGFFAPQGDGSDFSQPAYQRTLETGERVQLTDQQKLLYANHRLASSIYARERDKIEGSPNPAQAAILAQLRQRLRDDFEGYMSVPYTLPGKTPVEETIDGGAVEQALDNPLLRGTEAGEALNIYWRERARVVEAAQTNLEGSLTGWRTSNGGQPYRELLRGLGDQLSGDYPQFARLWDDFLSGEFKDDELGLDG